MNIVQTENLTKIFKSGRFSNNSVKALDNLTLNIEEKKIFGLLGPNGAGKTTLVKILLGIIYPTSGKAELFGKNISNHQNRRRVGFLPENHRFPEYMTGEQVLFFYGELSGMKHTELKKKSDEFLSLVDMEKWRKTKIKKYSKGMLQRLGLAQAMLNNPELIFLDEPTDGVDPIGRKQIRDILVNLNSEGKTILVNSHLLSEVELICDTVAILNKGLLVKEGTVEDLTVTENAYIIKTSDLSESILNTLLSQYKAEISSKNDFKYKSSSVEDLNVLIDFLRKEKILINAISQEKNSLEDLFINVIEQEAV